MNRAPTPLERAQRAYPRKLHAQQAYLAGWNVAAGLAPASTLVGSIAETVGQADYMEARAEAICRAQDGHGTRYYRGDPYQAVALQQAAALLRGSMRRRAA